MCALGDPAVTGPTAADTRGEDALAIIADMRSKVIGGRGSPWQRTFLATLDSDPRLTFRQCWERTEAHYAGSRADRYPHSFEN